LFWKKKNKPSEGSRIKAPSDHRGAFRISPDPDNPLTLHFKNKKINALDISSKGLSFTNDGFQSRKRYPVHFHLPGETDIISTKLDILRIDEEQICHCAFNLLTPDQEDAIHRYVLNRQKEDLRSR
jgi:hypothetical protein